MGRKQLPLSSSTKVDPCVSVLHTGVPKRSSLYELDVGNDNNLCTSGISMQWDSSFYHLRVCWWSPLSPWHQREELSVLWTSQVYSSFSQPCVPLEMIMTYCGREGVQNHVNPSFLPNSHVTLVFSSIRWVGWTGWFLRSFLRILFYDHKHGIAAHKETDQIKLQTGQSQVWLLSFAKNSGSPPAISISVSLPSGLPKTQLSDHVSDPKWQECLCLSDWRRTCCITHLNLLLFQGPVLASSDLMVTLTDSISSGWLAMWVEPSWLGLSYPAGSKYPCFASLYRWNSGLWTYSHSHCSSCIWGSQHACGERWFST